MRTSPGTLGEICMNACNQNCISTAVGAAAAAAARLPETVSFNFLSHCATLQLRPCPIWLTFFPPPSTSASPFRFLLPSPSFSISPPISATPGIPFFRPGCFLSATMTSPDPHQLLSRSVPSAGPALATFLPTFCPSVRRRACSFRALPRSPRRPADDPDPLYLLVVWKVCGDLNALGQNGSVSSVRGDTLGPSKATFRLVVPFCPGLLCGPRRRRGLLNSELYEVLARPMARNF